MQIVCYEHLQKAVVVYSRIFERIKINLMVHDFKSAAEQRSILNSWNWHSCLLTHEACISLDTSKSKTTDICSCLSAASCEHARALFMKTQMSGNASWNTWFYLPRYKTRKDERTLTHIPIPVAFSKIIKK